MDTFDWTVLALLATAIGAMLAFSKAARLVFVRSLLHPFTPGYIVTWEDGQVEFVANQPAHEIAEVMENHVKAAQAGPGQGKTIDQPHASEPQTS